MGMLRRESFLRHRRNNPDNNKTIGDRELTTQEKQNAILTGYSPEEVSKLTTG